MLSSSDTLQFSLSSHGDSILHKMNNLREEHRFCDVTLLLGSPNGSSGLSYRFHGHKVVLAASSDFLRDQFLLHEGRAELSVGVVSGVIVAKTLLLSCYTGFLEVPLKELLSYLTAASELQMSQVVNKCVQAISVYLTPSPFTVKLEKPSCELVSWPSSIFETLREKDAVQPSIQEDKTKEQGAVLSQHDFRVRQGSEADGREEVRNDRKEVEELPEAFGLDFLESENISTPKVFREAKSSTSSKFTSSAAHEGQVDHPQKQQEEQTEEGNMNAFCAQKIDGEISKSPSGSHVTNRHLSANVAEDINSIRVQKPYLCRKCDKIFQHLWSYVAHLKEHRQFSCLICGEAFSQRSKLSHHMRAHASVKPFRCPLCHGTFTQKALLQDHLRLHTAHRCVPSQGPSGREERSVLEEAGAEQQAKA